jgi:Ca-activated chloride channel family protein
MMPLTQSQPVTTVTPPTDAVTGDGILMKPSPTIAPIPEPSGAATARSATEFAEDDDSRVEALVAPEPLNTMAEATISVEAPMAASPKMALADAEGSLVSDAAPFGTENSEAFATGPANPVYVTAENPVSTFSIDVDTASYATVRSSLNAGFLPDPTSVRIEEMINYFPYAYPVPQRDAAFHPTVTVMPTPWNANTSLVHVAIQGAMPAIADRAPLNLVFLIDTSGSMDEPNKLPLLLQSLSLLQGQLHEYDQVAIVAYAGSAGQVLAPTKATDQTAILGALNQLAAGGSTAGAQGLELAYQTAEAMAAPGEVTRVLLATDGDFNVGIDDPEALKTYIAGKRETGVYLSVLGFGRGNLDDATMQALAQNGNGTAAYIDTLSEARKVLVDQLTGALFPIADNVKIQIEWNPAQVAEYRLIGYETRTLRREDFNNDAVDAGDIGAGTAVTAIYEVTAPNSPALRNDPLRYGTAEPAIGTPELGFLRLRSVAPGATASTLLETPILTGGQANNDARFAAAIAGFGQLLTGAVYLGDWGWDQAIELALGARGSDEFGYRIEAVNLMRAAKALNQ